MSEAFDVSVVISTYNRCSLLPEALESLLAQGADGVRYEVITVDNNSTDQTRQVVESFIRRGHSNLRYVFEPRQGLPYGRNAGIACAEAPIIAFTDDDVHVTPNWLINIKKAFDEHKEVDFMGGKILPRWTQEPPSWLTRDHWWPLALLDAGDEAFYVNARNPMVLPTANASFRKEVFSRFGLFAPQFSSSQDHEMLVRLWQAGRQGLYLPAIVVISEIDPLRMTKAYHRRWNFKTGKFNAMMRLNEIMGPDGCLIKEPPQPRKVFGVQLFIYRHLLSEALHWCRDIFQEGKRLQHENRICHLLGYMAKRFETTKP